MAGAIHQHVHRTDETTNNKKLEFIEIYAGISQAYYALYLLSIKMATTLFPKPVRSLLCESNMNPFSLLTKQGSIVILQISIAESPNKSQSYLVFLMPEEETKLIIRRNEGSNSSCFPPIVHTLSKSRTAGLSSSLGSTLPPVSFPVVFPKAAPLEAGGGVTLGAGAGLAAWKERLFLAVRPIMRMHNKQYHDFRTLAFTSAAAVTFSSFSFTASVFFSVFPSKIQS